ncbi:MAG TPA: nucleotidyl transferase AbiEii/AbiGii toxin family protein [Pyrinomonadaceae bacterium]
MSNTSLELSHKLPAEQVSIIRQVVRVAESQGLSLFIVGAQARDLLVQYAYDLPVQRITNDIDFGIVVESWDQFIRLGDSLIASKSFQSHKKVRQRLVHETGLFIDLVPFGGLEEVSGQISWPPDFSIVMSTVGFREAFDNSVQVRITGDLIVRVASLAGLALMKIIAWADRHFERDAQDLGLIMTHYLAAGNDDRVYTEHGDCFDLLNEEFDYERASVRILGRDVGRLLTSGSSAIVEQTLSQETDRANPEALAVVMTRNVTNYRGDYDVALSMVAELRKGISETYPY